MPWYFKNKYILTTLVFALWMAFLDEHNMILQWRLKSELNDLERDRVYYQQEIEKTRADLAQLLSDNEKLEKFARERYFMKNPDEEIFVFVEED